MELGGVMSTIAKCGSGFLSSVVSVFKHPSGWSVASFLFFKPTSDGLPLLLLEALLVKLDIARPRSMLGRDEGVETGVTEEAVG